MKTLKFGFPYIKKYIPGLAVVELMGFCAIFAEMMLPMLASMIIDHCILDIPLSVSEKGMFSFLLNGSYGEVRSWRLFRSISVCFVLCLLTRIVLVYIRNLYQQHAGLKMETRLRIETYHKLNELDSKTISKYNTGELLQTLNSDTIMFKELYTRIGPYFIDSIFILSTAVFMLSTLNIRLIVIPVLLSPVLAFALFRFRLLARENFRHIRKMSSEMNLAVTENIEAVRQVRSFTNEDLEMSKFDKINTGFKEKHLAQISLQSKFDLLFNSIKQFAYISTVCIASYLAIKGRIPVGLIAAGTSYVTNVMNSVTSLNNQLFQLQQQLIAGERIKVFLELESGIKDNKESKLVQLTPSLELKNVEIEDDDTVLLRDINVSVPYGLKLGIVGPTGGGKSVFLRSLIRGIDITEGSIEINGHDIKEYSLRNLRHMFSFVFQDVFLFSNSIDANIAYAKPEIDEEEVVRAARYAQADEFIRRLDDGYETVIGERGMGISGGQKQRVSIARAFLKDAPILVLDDSTSALDVSTEKRLFEEIDKHYSDRTVIIAAHRLSAVRHCDLILYIDGGRIKERGTYEELMAHNGDFAKVAKAQSKNQ
ncbi:MAG: ABC transporter ATP-binding protein/permease [Lachnospiraceae bacterium]|nr:ABC transporter ATP-binding protein/permease [Lachnospiraceae bacterium]